MQQKKKKKKKLQLYIQVGNWPLDIVLSWWRELLFLRYCSIVEKVKMVTQSLWKDEPAYNKETKWLPTPLTLSIISCDILFIHEK